MFYVICRHRGDYHFVKVVDRNLEPVQAKTEPEVWKIIDKLKARFTGIQFDYVTTIKNIPTYERLL